MDIFTHLFIGLLASLSLLMRICPEAIIFLWVMSFLPDFDVLLEPFRKIKKSYYLSHKAASHSYLIALFFTGILSLLISLTTNKPFLEIWLGGFIGYSIHITLDFFTASKIPIFYPLSKKEFRFIADRAINPFLAIFSGINLIVIIFYFFTLPYYHIFMDLTTFFWYIYLSYFGFRTVLRIIIQFKSPKGCQYIPGFLPISYLVFKNKSSEDKISFTLTRHSIFSPIENELLKTTVSKNSQEFLFYELALRLSREYRFFHKWSALIPFFHEDDETINILLILTESYSNTSSHYLSIIFNKKTRQVISQEEGFSSFKKWENFNIQLK
ncbi:MAG: metal-dependent hydrolase [Promethearchaeota archaeon]|jgi:membrane-bound metal-dependent hydrolase YbcI (DUF457 family)